MTKLDEAISLLPDYIQGKIPMENEQLALIGEAARSCAALLKLAPEIGKLADVCGEHPPIEDVGAVTNFLIGNGSALFFARPALKAIYENLTKFGKDTSHD